MHLLKNYNLKLQSRCLLFQGNQAEFNDLAMENYSLRFVKYAGRESWRRKMEIDVRFCKLSYLLFYKSLQKNIKQVLRPF